MFEANDSLYFLTENEKRELMLSLEELAQIEGLRDYSASDSGNANYSELRIMVDNKAEKNDVIRHDGSVGLTNDWDVGEGFRIKIDEIRARSSGGLKLSDDGGNGLLICDGGNICIGANTTPSSQVFINAPGTSSHIAFSVFDTARTESAFEIKRVSSSGYRFLSKGASTVSSADSTGFTILTSGNAAQFVCVKGIWLGSSYASAGANTGEIKTQSGIDITLSPSSSVVITDSKNLSLGTTTGTKIGTNASQKIGFYNATPVTQRAKANYNNWTSISDVVRALVDLGLFDQV